MNDNKRAYRRFMRNMKIRKRVKYPMYNYQLSPRRKGLLADTPKPCSSPMCCGNRRTIEGPTIQERKHEAI